MKCYELECTVPCVSTETWKVLVPDDFDVSAFKNDDWVDLVRSEGKNVKVEFVEEQIGGEGDREFFRAVELHQGGETVLFDGEVPW